MFDKIVNWLTEHWIIVLIVFACIVTILFAYGCEPKTTSLHDRGTEVTRSELLDEFELMTIRFERKIVELDRQDEIRNLILQQSLLIAETGTVNPLGLLTSLLAIIGVGATADDVRLRRQRRKLVRYEPNVEVPNKTANNT